jgi:hypothetical protein
MTRVHRKSARPRRERRWRDRPEAEEDDEREAIVMCLDCDERVAAAVACPSD